MFGIKIVSHSVGQSVNQVFEANNTERDIRFFTQNKFFPRTLEQKKLFAGQVDTRLPGRVRRQAGELHHRRRRIVRPSAIVDRSPRHVQGQQRRVACARDARTSISTTVDHRRCVLRGGQHRPRQQRHLQQTARYDDAERCR